MNIKKLILLIPITLIGIFSFAQTVKIDAVRGVEDDFFKKSQAILPIYRYFCCDKIEPYTKFGVELDANREWFEIKAFPDLSYSKDTGYTYVYFSGADNAINEGYVLALIGNYRRSRRTVYFYIDKNNDFDFTNDGAPDSMTYRQNSKIITMANKEIDSALYSIKLTRFQYGVNVPYKNLLRDHYRKHSGKKVFTDINYCYRVQRYNCIRADYNNGIDSFSIGIKDVNVNGIYNESCVDKLYVGAYKSQIVSDNLFDMTPTISNIAFEWNGKKYRFRSIETTGAYVEIVEDKNAKLTNKLEVGKKVPDFTYFNIVNQKQSLRKYKKQPIYLFFWDKDNLTSEDTTYLNKIHKEFENEIKLITLNHGDEPKQVRIMFYYDKIQWPIGYSNTDIARDFFLEDTPRGYYLGKKNKLIDDRISPKEMYEKLKNNQL